MIASGPGIGGLSEPFLCGKLVYECFSVDYHLSLLFAAMFGFMRPCYRNPAYSQVYCHACRHLKTRYGAAAIPFLSYEAAFLHALAVDMGWINVRREKKCGWPWGASVRHPGECSENENRIGEFSAAFTLLLLATKLEDDIRDGNSTLARALSAFYRQSILKSRRFFHTLDADFGEKLRRLIAEHHFLETPGRFDENREMIHYATPTAEAFSWIFTLFARYLNADTATEAWLAEAGFLVGASLIQADCAFDWEKDAKYGDFNPVLTLKDSAHAYEESQRNLRRLHKLCAEKFGEESLSAQIALGTHDRLYYIVKKDKRYHEFLCEKMSAGTVHASAACPTVMLLAQTEQPDITCTQFGCYVCICCSTLSVCFGLCAPCREEDSIPTNLADMCCASATCVQISECVRGKGQ